MTEGLSGSTDARTFLDGTVGAWRARSTGVVAPEGVVWSQKAVAAVRALGPGDHRAAPRMELAGPVVALTGAPTWLALVAPGADAYTRAEALPLETFDAGEREIPGMTLPTGPLRVADGWVLPVGHWTQLLWANLLALGPFLWERLVGDGAGAVLRLAWGAARAGSVAPEDVAARLTVRGPGARIHRNATVEGCWLGAGARVGAGAVVRGAVIGDGAVVEELALVEGAVIGAGARVQRLAMVKYSLVEEASAFAGFMQLGVIGKGAVVKHGATLMDMAFGQSVRVRVGGALVPAPHGLCGVCVGDGATVASGVRIAPGRAIRPGLEILADPGQVLTRTDLPDGVTRAYARAGGLEAD